MRCLLAADIVLSDTLIALGLLSWIGCAVAGVASKRQEALVPLLICFAMYAWGAGAFGCVRVGISGALAHLLCHVRVGGRWVWVCACVCTSMSSHSLLWCSHI